MKIEKPLSTGMWSRAHADDLVFRVGWASSVKLKFALPQ